MDAVSPTIINLIIFVLAIYVGYHVVWTVTPALHTPLKAGTHAQTATARLGARRGGVVSSFLGTLISWGRCAGVVVGGGGGGMRAYLQSRLFGPLAMTSADPRFDAAGTFIGSSFLYCTAQDFAAFGELYRDGAEWCFGALGDYHSGGLAGALKAYGLDAS